MPPASAPLAAGAGAASAASTRRDTAAAMLHAGPGRGCCLVRELAAAPALGVAQCERCGGWWRRLTAAHLQTGTFGDRASVFLIYRTDCCDESGRTGKGGRARPQRSKQPLLPQISRPATLQARSPATHDLRHGPMVRACPRPPRCARCCGCARRCCARWRSRRGRRRRGRRTCSP